MNLIDDFKERRSAKKDLARMGMLERLMASNRVYHKQLEKQIRALQKSLNEADEEYLKMKREYHFLSVPEPLPSDLRATQSDVDDQVST